MSKKVVILSSSPRKGGNSDALCDEFFKGAKSSGNEVEKIFLKDKNISYCTGCGYCNTVNQTACAIKDDMEEALELMINSDVIVLATPVYFYTMCGQLKTFIDRCCAKYTQIRNKEFYFIMTAADGSKSSFDKVLEEFKGFLSCLGGAKVKGSISASGVWQKDDIKNTQYLKQAYEMGADV